MMSAVQRWPTTDVAMQPARAATESEQETTMRARPHVVPRGEIVDLLLPFHAGDRALVNAARIVLNLWPLEAQEVNHVSE